MARRRNSSRHRRRGRFAFLNKVLSMLGVCGAGVAALTLFFRVETMEITGLERYSAEEVSDASGVQTGDNLYLLNKYDVVSRIQEALPYVEQIRINRRLPDTLVIEVTECAEPLAIVQDGSAWLVST